MAIDYRDQLDRATFAIRDKVGQVLSSGSQIMSCRDRASQYLGSSNAQAAALAAAIVSKATGLLNNYKAIEADAVTATGRANDLRAKMDQDPTWKGLLNDPSSLMKSLDGWGAVAAINSMISNAVRVISDLTTLSLRADKHLSAVTDLSSNTDDLDAFAQGKGLSAKLAQVTSFGSTVAGLAGNYLTFAKYAAIAVGLFFVWDLAKPLLVSSRRKTA